MKTLSIQEVESSNTTVVWGMNNTKAEHRGSIIFNVPSSNGSTGIDSVVLPQTFLPMNLTEQVTKRQLLESSQFRRAIASGMLSIIEDEEARQMHQLPGADLEREKLKREMINGVTGIGDDALGVNVGLESTSSSNGNRIDNVLPAVVTLTLDLEEKDPVEVVNSLRNLRMDMSKEDYEYVLNKARDGKIEQVEKHCRNRLKELAGK